VDVDVIVDGDGDGDEAVRRTGPFHHRSRAWGGRGEHQIVAVAVNDHVNVHVARKSL
jgi:hypothetical protein